MLASTLKMGRTQHSAYFVFYGAGTLNELACKRHVRADYLLSNPALHHSATIANHNVWGGDNGRYAQHKRDHAKRVDVREKQFLPRTGMQYTDLVELLKAQFINSASP